MADNRGLYKRETRYGGPHGTHAPVSSTDYFLRAHPTTHQRRCPFRAKTALGRNPKSHTSPRSQKHAIGFKHRQSPLSPLNDNRRIAVI